MWFFGRFGRNEDFEQLSLAPNLSAAVSTVQTPLLVDLIIDGDSELGFALGSLGNSASMHLECVVHSV